MAEQVSKSERRDLDRPEGPSRKYPWDEWADGSQWKIVQGIDFDTTIDSMVGNIHSAARRVTDKDGIRIKRALTSTGTDDNTGKPAIWFEIVDRDPVIIEDERAKHRKILDDQRAKVQKVTKKKATRRKPSDASSSKS